MRLALAILFLWLGSALLWVAFGGLGKNTEGTLNHPGDVVKSLHDTIDSKGSAYTGEEAS